MKSLASVFSSLRSGVSILLAAAKDAWQKDNIVEWAAAIAFYALLSVFPLLLATISFAAYFVQVDWAVSESTRVLGRFLPHGSRLIEETVREALEVRPAVSLLGIAALLWSASRVFGVLGLALNFAYEVPKGYSWLKQTALQLAMTLVTGVLLLLAFALDVASDTLARTLQPWKEWTAFALRLFGGLLSTCMLLAVFTAVYQWVPRGKQNWQASLSGSAVATVLLVLARPLFIGYFARLAHYNLVYGSLAILVLLLLWAWIVGIIVLFGGEVASHTQRRRSQPASTKNPVRP